LAECVLEFINCQDNFPIEPILHDLLIHLLSIAGHYTQLHQLVQSNIIPDSLGLAEALSKADDHHSNNFKLAIEVLKRLECHHDVLLLLTEAGQLLTAIQYAQHTNTLKYISPLPILELALQSGNKTTFLNVYKCFEEHGLLPLGTQVNDSSTFGNNGIARFISVFREIWGPHIEMESV
jgi:hypothetical protein